jgi:hypothetical protein
VRDAVGRRFADIGLTLHPDKTKIVYCTYTIDPWPLILYIPKTCYYPCISNNTPNHQL